jgi:hypothetical protein
MTDSSSDLLASCLELVADGQLDPDDAIRRCGNPDRYADPLLAKAWHLLSHFVNDRDIRRRDSDYESQQMARLREYAKAIREHR